MRCRLLSGIFCVASCPTGRIGSDSVVVPVYASEGSGQESGGVETNCRCCGVMICLS